MQNHQIQCFGPVQWKPCNFYMTCQSVKKTFKWKLCITTSCGQIQPRNVPAFTPLQKRFSTLSLAMGPSMRNHFPTMVSSFWLLAFNCGISNNNVQASKKKIYVYIQIYACASMNMYINKYEKMTTKNRQAKTFRKILQVTSATKSGLKAKVVLDFPTSTVSMSTWPLYGIEIVYVPFQPVFVQPVFSAVHGPNKLKPANGSGGSKLAKFWLFTFACSCKDPSADLRSRSLRLPRPTSMEWSKTNKANRNFAWQSPQRSMARNELGKRRTNWRLHV